MTRADLLVNAERHPDARPAASCSVPDRVPAERPWHGSAHAELARLEQRALAAEARAAEAEALLAELRAELAARIVAARSEGARS